MHARKERSESLAGLAYAVPRSLLAIAIYVAPIFVVTKKQKSTTHVTVNRLPTAGSMTWHCAPDSTLEDMQDNHFCKQIK